MCSIFANVKKNVAPELAVARCNLLIDMKDFLNGTGVKVSFISYPNKAEFMDKILWKNNSTPLKDFLLSAGVQNITDLTGDPKWNITLYRDEIHPRTKGNSKFALIIKSRFNMGSK